MYTEKNEITMKGKVQEVCEVQAVFDFSLPKTTELEMPENKKYQEEFHPLLKSKDQRSQEGQDFLHDYTDTNTYDEYPETIPTQTSFTF